MQWTPRRSQRRGPPSAGTARGAGSTSASGEGVTHPWLTDIFCDLLSLVDWSDLHVFRVGMDLKKVLGEEEKKKRFPKTQKKSQEQKETTSQPVSPSNSSKSEQNQEVAAASSASPYLTSPPNFHQQCPAAGGWPHLNRNSLGSRPAHGAQPLIHHLPAPRTTSLTPNERLNDSTSQTFSNQLITNIKPNQTIPQVSPYQRASVIENSFIKGSNIAHKSQSSSKTCTTLAQTQNDNQLSSNPSPANSAGSSPQEVRANPSTESPPSPQEIQRVSVIRKTSLTNKKTMTPSNVISLRTIPCDFLESNHQMVKKYWYQKHLLSRESNSSEIVMSPKLDDFGAADFHAALSDENESDLENIVIENGVQFIKQSEVLEHIYNTYLFDDLSVPFMEERREKFLAYWHGVNFGEEVVRSNIALGSTRAAGAVPVDWVKMGHYVFRSP